MFERSGPASRGECGYARFLLQERRQELQALELKRRRNEILLADYLSCQRSLVQTIGELASLVRGYSDADAGDHDDSIDPSRPSCSDSDR